MTPDYDAIRKTFEEIADATADGPPERAGKQGGLNRWRMHMESKGVSPRSDWDAVAVALDKRRRKRNAPRLLLMVVGMLGVLASHRAIPDPYRAQCELASQLVALAGGVFYERKR